MAHSRVQQVLREARAMVGTVRPQTPCAPPARLSSLGASGSASSTSAFGGGSLPMIGSGSQGGSAAFRAERLGSPPGTPPPEMEMLVTTDREVKGIVGRNTAVGQQWAQALLSMDVRVRHRSAANIFRHCEDELLDTALMTVTRNASSSSSSSTSSATASALTAAAGGSNINVNLLKSEGALAALLVVARNPHVHSSSAVTSAAASSSLSSSINNSNNNTTNINATNSKFERLTRVSMILAAAAETEGLQSYLVTSGAIQTIGELIPKILGLGAGGAAAAGKEGGSSSTPPPTPLMDKVASAPLAPFSSLPLTALFNLLTALRVLCVDYPHHILKVGLLDALLKLFDAASALTLSHDGNNSDNIPLESATAANATPSMASLRPASGAFASRFAFSSVPKVSAAASASSSNAAPSAAAVANTAAQISSVIIRIFCQLSFDDDCLNDFRLRRDNFVEPLLLYLASPIRVDPLKDPLLVARLMLLIARVIDGQHEVCEDVVEYHWDTVVSKTFECLQKRREIAKVVANSMRQQQQLQMARPPSGIIRTGSASALHSMSRSASGRPVSAANSSDATAAAETSDGLVSSQKRAKKDGENASSSQQSSSSAFIDTITSDAVIAALALLSNVTLVEEGGFTLATSLPHMQCLMELVNSDYDAAADDATAATGGAANKKEPAALSDDAKKAAKEARVTTIRYALIVLSNLSFYLPMMDADAGDGGEDGEPNAESGRNAIVTALALSVCGFLFEGDSEATLEATRILGNLSRTFEGRLWMEENGADEALVLFLGHEDHRLVYNCLGVLLNLTADDECEPSVCSNSEAVSLLLKHTQRLVSGNAPWEIKEVVQMLLQNVQRHEIRQEEEAMMMLEGGADLDEGALTGSFNTNGVLRGGGSPPNAVNAELEALTEE